MRNCLLFGEVCTRSAALALVLCLGAPPAQAQPGDNTIIDAREALRKKDRAKLVAARATAAAQEHPLALWVDYWELSDRLGEARQEELNAFYARWSGSYVEDRLRNDWLLELGRRRDWANFAAEMPRFRMNDDREVTCYSLLAEHASGKDVRDKALVNWFEQRDSDDGCALMAATLVDAKVLSSDDIWLKLRLSVEQGRARLARSVAALVDKQAAAEVGELLDNPVRYLRRPGAVSGRHHQDLALLAVLRAATGDPEATAALMDERWQAALGPDRAAWAWSVIGKQAALKLSNEAPTYFKRAWAQLRGTPKAAHWSDDTLAWAARSASISGTRKLSVVGTMPPHEAWHPCPATTNAMVKYFTPVCCEMEARFGVGHNSMSA